MTANLSFLSNSLVVVAGAGASGFAAARLLARAGARVRLLEKNPEKASPQVRDWAATTGVELVTGEHAPGQFLGASLVVASPGIPLAALRPLLPPAPDGSGEAVPLWAETELALRCVDQPILAVTGTSGKTTTASLAAAMLEAAGKKVFLGGNIGTPLSEYVLSEDPADVLVLELSSFQLQGCFSLRPRVAVLLNLTENHLDHHRDMQEYADAKFSLFRLQTEADAAVLHPDLLRTYRDLGCRARARVFQPGGRFSGLRLAGTHNAANAEAAFLACAEFGVAEEDAVRAARAFAPLRHRLEQAAEAHGVRYVNDSKSTTVEALRVALCSFESVVLLAGGTFKGGDLASLRSLVRERVRAVCLFGSSRNVFEAAWEGCAPLSWDPDLDVALPRAAALARAGDVVLLSPATSSFDQYPNYLARGDHFCALARTLAHAPERGPQEDASE